LQALARSDKMCAKIAIRSPSGLRIKERWKVKIIAVADFLINFAAKPNT